MLLSAGEELKGRRDTWETASIGRLSARCVSEAGLSTNGTCDLSKPSARYITLHSSRPSNNSEALLGLLPVERLLPPLLGETCMGAPHVRVRLLHEVVKAPLSFGLIRHLIARFGSGQIRPYQWSLV